MTAWSGTCGICHAPLESCHCVLDADTREQRDILDAGVARVNAHPELRGTLPGNGAHGPFLLTFTSSGGSLGAGKP